MLFAAGDHVARALDAAELPALQALFDACPGYFECVSGAPARPDEAQQAFDARPPQHLPFTRQHAVGCWRGPTLDAVAIVVEDLCATGVWHIALFLVAAALHGSGVAQRLHAALQAWAAAGGARWLRLGVVSGNTRAERFWHGQGYVEVRTRPLGDRTSRVLVKPLRPGATLAAYLEHMPRDDPGSDLP